MNSPNVSSQEKSVGMGILVDQVDELMPSDRGWLANGDGTGPNALGRTYSVLVTGRLRFQGTISRLARDLFSGRQDSNNEENLEDPAVRYQKARIENPGLMLGSQILNNFFEGLKKQYPFTLIHNFYIFEGSSINDKSFDEVKEILDATLKSCDLPLVIPVVLRGDNFFEISHIATIMIKDDKIGYFDPKGVVSSNQNLKDGKTLRDVLEYLNDTICLGEGTIFENPTTHQFDTNNCGVFACYYIYKVLKGEPLNAFAKERIPLSDILEFRNEILRIGFSREQNLSVEREEPDDFLDT